MKILPNLVTILGLCAGMTSILFLLGGEYRFAAGLIVLATVFDGLDGLLARSLNATSDFGAELDSLVDSINFGVAPGVLVFQVLLSDALNIGWLFVLAFTICCCFRLARFNAETAVEEEPKRHFVGVPAPAGALLALLPLFLLFGGVVDTSATPFLTAFWLGLVGAAMVSRLPTFSPRSMFISGNRIVWLLFGAAIMLGGVLTRFWLCLIVIDVAYILLLMRSVVVTARRNRA